MNDNFEYIHEKEQNCNISGRKGESPFSIEMKYLALFENTSAGIAIISKDGSVSHSNSCFSYISGYSGDELKGFNFTSMFCKDDTGKVKKILSMCFTGCNPNTNFEVRFRKKDGLQAWGDLSISEQWEGEDHKKYCYVFLHDISEEKKYKEASKTAIRKINLIGNLAKQDMIARLTAIDCYLELADDKINSESKQFCGVVGHHIESVKKYMKFTSDLHDAGLYRPEWHLLSEVFDEVRSFDERIPVEYDIRFKRVEVLSDHLLVPVFEKMFENSIKHGKFTTKINIGFSEDNSGSIFIIWKDNGLGIPLNMKDKIFVKGHGSDTGFGLLLVKEILSFSGAKIKEKGIPGEGAVFEIKIPSEYCRHIS